jgi:hypothetical protein
VLGRSAPLVVADGDGLAVGESAPDPHANALGRRSRAHAYLAATPLLTCFIFPLPLSRPSRGALRLEEDAQAQHRQSGASERELLCLPLRGASPCGDIDSVRTFEVGLGVRMTRCSRSGRTPCSAESCADYKQSHGIRNDTRLAWSTSGRAARGLPRSKVPQTPRAR